MRNIKVINFKDINPIDFIFCEPKKTKSGSYLSEVKYLNEDKRIFIQFPKLRAPKGVVTNFLTLEISKDKWNFFEFITSIDNYCIKYVYENSKNWFSGEYTYEMIEDSYKNLIKITNTNSPPSIRMKILNNKEENAAIFNSKREVQNVGAILENMNVVVLVEFVGLKFLRTTVKPEWRIVQIKLFEHEYSNINDYLINDEYLSDNIYEDLSDIEYETDDILLNEMLDDT